MQSKKTQEDAARRGLLHKRNPVSWFRKRGQSGKKAALGDTWPSIGYSSGRSTVLSDDDTIALSEPSPTASQDPAQFGNPTAPPEAREPAAEPAAAAAILAVARAAAINARPEEAEETNAAHEVAAPIVAPAAIIQALPEEAEETKAAQEVAAPIVAPAATLQAHPEEAEETKAAQEVAARIVAHAISVSVAARALALARAAAPSAAAAPPGLLGSMLSFLNAAIIKCLAPQMDSPAPRAFPRQGSGRKFARQLMLSAIYEEHEAEPLTEPQAVFGRWKDALEANGLLVRVADDKGAIVGRTVLDGRADDPAAHHAGAAIDSEVHGLSMMAAATFHDAQLFADLSATAQWAAKKATEAGAPAAGLMPRSLAGFCAGGLFTLAPVPRELEPLPGVCASPLRSPAQRGPGVPHATDLGSSSSGDLSILGAYEAAFVAASVDRAAWGDGPAASYERLAKDYARAALAGDVGLGARMPHVLAAGSRERAAPAGFGAGCAGAAWAPGSADLRAMEVAALLNEIDRPRWERVAAAAAQATSSVLTGGSFHKGMGPTLGDIASAEPGAVARSGGHGYVPSKLPASLYEWTDGGRLITHGSTAGAEAGAMMLRLASELRAHRGVGFGVGGVQVVGVQVGGGVGASVSPPWLAPSRVVAQSMADALGWAFMTQRSAGVGFGATADVYSLEAPADSFSLSAAHSPALLLPLVALLDAGVADTFGAGPAIKALGAGTPHAYPWLCAATLLRGREATLALLGYACSAEALPETALAHLDLIGFESNDEFTERRSAKNISQHYDANHMPTLAALLSAKYPPVGAPAAH